MSKHKLRSRLAAASSIGAAALAASMAFGTTTASALVVPPPPTEGVYPSFLNGNAEGIRDSGSDTTFYMMQTLGDMFTAAGLYGCNLNLDNATCNTGGNVPTTDTADNWDRTEVTAGTDDVGSGAGQKQLCGTIPNPFTIDFARSSKPISAISGCNMVQTGYAKDGVPVIDFPTVNPGLIGAVSATDGEPWAAAAEGSANKAANGGLAVIGPVAEGWLPGDPVGGPYTGTPYTNITNNDSGGGAASVAYRIWCATDSTRITDWGQLTNLAVGQVPGQGTPIGIPIHVVGVNSASGTNATFANFAQSGDGTGNCNSTNVSNTNAAGDPNPVTAPSPNTPPQALENNASQVGDFSASDFPNDPADQAVEVATSLYYESNGVYSTNDYADIANLTAGTGSLNGQPSAYVGNEMQENGQTVSIAEERANTFPTARTLFNIYNSATLRGSAAGFINWLCDSQNAITKQKDNDTGQTFDAEITTAINTTYGFSRLTDTTSELANTKIIPADNQSAPNSTCDATTSGMTTTATPPTANVQSGSTTVTLSAGNWPAAIKAGTKVTDPAAGGTSAIPANDTVVSNNGTTLTLATAASGTNATDTLVFPGVDAVTVVANPST
jgi:hypothetical protein